MNVVANDLFFVETARRVAGDAVKLEATIRRGEDVLLAFDSSVLAACVHVQAASAATTFARRQHYWVADAIVHWSSRHDELAQLQVGLNDCMRIVSADLSTKPTWLDMHAVAFRDHAALANALRSLTVRDELLCFVNRDAMDAAAPLLADLVSLSAATRGGHDPFWAGVSDALRESESVLELVSSDYAQHHVPTPLADIEPALDPDEILLTSDDESAGLDEAEEVRRDSLELARTLRDELLRTVAMYSAAEVERLARGETTDSNPSQYAARLRKERRLLGVRHGGRFLHPVFQFDPATRQPHVAMRDVLAALPASEDGWTALFWCYRPNGKLAGQRPADIFAIDALAVIDAAEREFVKDRVHE